MPLQEPLEFSSLSALGEYLDHLIRSGSPARRALGRALKAVNFTDAQFLILESQVSANLTRADRTAAAGGHRAAGLVKKSLLDGPSNLAFALRYSPPTFPFSEDLESSLLEHIALTEIAISNTALILDIPVRNATDQSLKAVFDVTSSAKVTGFDVLCHLADQYLPAVTRLTVKLFNLTSEPVMERVRLIQQNLAKIPVKGVVYLQPIDAHRWTEAAGFGERPYP